MNRYKHWMQSPTRKTFPAKILCLDCETEFETIGEMPIRQKESAKVWYIYSLVLRDSEYKWEWDAVTGQIEMLWDIIRGYVTETSFRWILSYEASRIWGLAGLWERLESGTVRIIGPDPHQIARDKAAMRVVQQKYDNLLRPVSAGTMSRLRDRWKGHLVIQNPPNSASIRCQGCSGKAMWLDIRNYGISKPEEITQGEATVKWLGETINMISRAVRETNLGSLCHTTGSQALHGFKAGYLRHNIHVHNESTAIAIESGGYFGGRCECFKIGAIPIPVWHLDIRSSYGYAMFAHHFPAGLRSYNLSGDKASESVNSVPDQCISECTIETEEPAYPYKSDDGIIYPVGRFNTVLAGPELVDAVKRNRVVAVTSAVTYKMEPCLHDYAKAVYGLRQANEQAGNMLLANYAKGMLVALPGKLAQQDWRWEDCPKLSASQPYGEWYAKDGSGNYRRYRAIAWEVQKEVNYGWSYDAVPSIAAFVTSYARVLLLSFIRIAGWENVYYCDTDSLMVNEHGLQRLQRSDCIHQGKIGFLYVKSGPNATSIWGTKHYVENDRLVCSGFAKGMHEHNENTGHYWHYNGAYESIRKGNRPSNIREYHKFERSKAYTGRMVSESGLTKPHRLGD